MCLVVRNVCVCGTESGREILRANCIAKRFAQRLRLPTRCGQADNRPRSHPPAPKHVKAGRFPTGGTVSLGPAGLSALVPLRGSRGPTRPGATGRHPPLTGARHVSVEHAVLRRSTSLGPRPHTTHGSSLSRRPAPLACVTKRGGARRWGCGSWSTHTRPLGQCVAPRRHCPTSHFHPRPAGVGREGPPLPRRPRPRGAPLPGPDRPNHTVLDAPFSDPALSTAFPTASPPPAPLSAPRPPGPRRVGRRGPDSYVPGR